MERRMRLLEQDVEGIAVFLHECGLADNGEERSVEIDANGDLVVIRNFPLADGYDPDFVDLLLLTHRYPDAPPEGLYLLERNNAEVIAQLSRKFNVMQSAAYSAPTVPGYRWICFHHSGHGWKFNRRNVRAGDNLRKFLVGFYAQTGA